ncbi:MAG: hypothetical protein O6928_05945, partial [Gammaproteobacteria bacterium]|nr:hypothetical protein [Gammaproteobacteria bacterium]
MTSENKFTVYIHLIHGETIKFETNVSDANLIGVAEDLEKALSRNSLAFEMDGKLVLVPYSNVKYIEFDPAP